MEINKLYDNFCNDFNQNFYTHTKEELQYFKSILTKEDIDKMALLVDEIFTYPLQSVTYDRPNFVSHLDTHQYFSIGMYFWPNPDTEDGLPYIRKDGQVNPDAIRWAKGGLRRVALLTNWASMMYYLTDDKKYYELMKKHLTNFLVNEDTKMLPNLNYAQLIMGHPTAYLGRGSGIIDFGGQFGYALVMVKNLYDLNLIEEDFYQSLVPWVTEFLNWLTTSKFGLEEKYANNNHGTMYSLVCAHLNYFIGTLDNVKDDIFNEVEKRMADQIDESGRMYHELARTRSLAYTMMNVKAFIDCYKILGVDYTTKAPIKKAFEYILPVLNHEMEIGDITVIDDKTGILRPCMQLEGTYHENYKYYLKYLGDKFGLDVKLDLNYEVPYKYYFTK